MPEPPQKRPLPWIQRGWQKQFAPVFIILMLLAGVIFTQRTFPSGNNLPGFVVTAHAATATSTNTPTATVVQEPATMSAEGNSALPEVKPAEITTGSALSAFSLVTPEPLPSPVASIGRSITQ